MPRTPSPHSAEVHLGRLTARATHGEVQRHVAAFLEEVLDWKLTTESRSSGGIIDSLPIGPADRPIPVFLIEYKSGASRDLGELERKPGSRPGQNALEQLVLYMTTQRLTLFGILADASRLAIYANVGRASTKAVFHLEFKKVTADDLAKLRARLPLSTDTAQQLEIADQDEFVAFLAETIATLRDPLVRMLGKYRPRELDLFARLLPVGTSVDEFADKTAASLVSKLLLIRALEDQNERFGAIINPVVAKSFGNTKYGFLVLTHSAYELAGTKFPHVFKSDIDVFDWWFPGNMTSQYRALLTEEFADINTRLFNVLQRLWAYRIRVKADLMGLAYQKLRTRTETAVLGAYFTPPDLTEYTIEVLIRYLDKPTTKLSPADLLDARGTQHRVIDLTCGSGTFLVSLAAKAIESTRRAPEDAASDLVARLNGIDIDPLAVLMARSQVFAALAPNLRTAPPPHVYWQNTLRLLDPPGEQLALFDSFSEVGTAIEEAKHDTEESRKTVRPGAFSFVIGNPPWGRRSQIGRRMRAGGVPEYEIEKRLNDLMGGRWAPWFVHRDDNLLTPFVSIAAELLADGGVLALILDARFIAAEWGERVIKTLSESFVEVRVLDISMDRSFRYSASYPAIVLAQRQRR
jgi:hypothetical protein